MFNIMKEACEDIGLDFNENKYNQFVIYKDLLKEWNEKINLTAITDDTQIFIKHFVDSIEIFKFPFLKTAKNIIDVGTGAGFPGLPMKIVKPDLNLVLLDSLNKRINFLNEVIKELSLENIKTIHSRAEDLSRERLYRESFDASVSRAVANLSVLCELCIPYIKVGGYFVALKGPAITEELKAAEKAISVLGGKLEKVIQVKISDTDLQHNVVVIKKIKSTPNQYPRKAAAISKNPIK